MENVSVSVRVRPLNDKETAANAKDQWRIAGNTMSQLVNDKVVAANTYTFDHIFGQETSTPQIYNACIKDLITSAMDGVNATMFAYGQTGSGKTFTLKGSESNPGIIPLAVEHVFSFIEAHPEREYLLRLSYFEIYNEQIRDLLKENNNNLKIHEDARTGIFIGGITEEVVTTPDKIHTLMGKGEKLRAVGVTNMNERSSRSHVMFRMVIESRERGSGENGAVRVAHLNLVDLAGSERIAKTGAKGTTRKEGAHINKSLLTLGTVIGKLSSKGEAGHIPYRDSKLTRILEPSLGGNTRTAIICAVTTANMHVDETNSTLRFASRAKRIKNKVKVNEILDDAGLLKKYKRELRTMKKTMKTLQKGGAVKEITQLKSRNESLEEQKKRLEKEQADLETKVERLKALFVSSTQIGAQQRSVGRRETWSAPRGGRALLSPSPAQRHRIHQQLAPMLDGDTRRNSSDLMDFRRQLDLELMGGGGGGHDARSSAASSASSTSSASSRRDSSGEMASLRAQVEMLTQEADELRSALGDARREAAQLRGTDAGEAAARIEELEEVQATLMGESEAAQSKLNEATLLVDATRKEVEERDARIEFLMEEMEGHTTSAAEAMQDIKRRVEASEASLRASKTREGNMLQQVAELNAELGRERERVRELTTRADRVDELELELQKVQWDAQMKQVEGAADVETLKANLERDFETTKIKLEALQRNMEATRTQSDEWEQKCKEQTVLLREFEARACSLEESLAGAQEEMEVLRARAADAASHAEAVRTLQSEKSELKRAVVEAQTSLELLSMQVKEDLGKDHTRDAEIARLQQELEEEQAFNREYKAHQQKNADQQKAENDARLKQTNSEKELLLQVIESMREDEEELKERIAALEAEKEGDAAGGAAPGELSEEAFALMEEKLDAARAALAGKESEWAAKETEHITQHEALTTQHEALTTQHAELTAQHEALTTQHEAVTAQVAELTAQLDAAGQEAERLSSRNDELAAKDSEAGQTREALKAAEAAMGELEALLKHEKEAACALEERVRTLEGECKRVEAAQLESDNKASSKTGELEAASKRVGELEAEVRSATEELAKCRMELKVTQSTMETSMSQMTVELSAKVQALEKANTHVERLEGELADARSRASAESSKHEDDEAALEGWQKKVQQLETTLALKEQELSKAQAKSSRKKSSRTSDAHSFLPRPSSSGSGGMGDKAARRAERALVAAKERAEKERDQAVKELDKVKGKAQTMSDKLKQLNQDRANASSERVRMEADLKGVQRENKHLAKEVDKLKKAVDDHKTRHHDVSSELAALKRERETMVRQVEKAAGAQSRFDASLKRKEEKIAELEGDLKELRAELREVKANTEAELKRMMEDNENLTQLLEEMTEALEKVKAHEQELETRVETLTAERDDFERRRDEAHERIDAALEQLESASADNDELRSAATQLERDLHAAQAQLEQLETLREQARAQAAELESTRGQLTEMSFAQEEQTDMWQSELNKLAEQLERSKAACADAEQHAADVQGELASARAAGAEKDKELARTQALQVEVNHLKGKVSSMGGERAELASKVKELSAELRETTSARNKLEEEVQGLRGDVSRHSESHGAMQGELCTLRADKEALTARTAALEGEVAALQAAGREEKMANKKKQMALKGKLRAANVEIKKIRGWATSTVEIERGTIEQLRAQLENVSN